jgi:hypothetical protein
VPVAWTHEEEQEGGGAARAMGVAAAVLTYVGPVPRLPWGWHELAARARRIPAAGARRIPAARARHEPAWRNLGWAGEQFHHGPVLRAPV